MKVNVRNYEQMRAWLAVMVPEVFPEWRPETDPIKFLDDTAAVSPANARKGLAMAINDSVDLAEDWAADRVAAIDDRLSNQGLPTLTDIRATFSREIQRVVRRGRIASEVEYYAVRNAVEMPGSDADSLWQLLEAYEQQQA